MKSDISPLALNQVIVTLKFDHNGYLLITNTKLIQ